MATFKDEAIVLKQFDLGEADKIITFYSKNNGKVRAVAKGTRKTKSSLSGLVLPFSYNEITVYQGRSLARLNYATGKFSFPNLREDLMCMAYANVFAELVEKVGLEGEADQQLFALLLISFHRLHKLKEEQYLLISLLFKIKLIVMLGFKPTLNRCAYCESEIRLQGKNYFQIAHGGLICNKCLKFEQESYYQLSGESVAILKSLFNKDMEYPRNLRISNVALNQLNRLADNFLMYHLDFKIKSLDFLHSLQEMC